MNASVAFLIVVLAAVAQAKPQIVGYAAAPAVYSSYAAAPVSYAAAPVSYAAAPVAYSRGLAYATPYARSFGSYYF